MIRTTRKLDVPPTAEDIEAVATYKATRQEKLNAREDNLLATEKRWMRRHRRACNALKKIRAALRRCQRAQETLSH